MKCTVITSDLADSKTDCQVSITISGDQGRSEVITLDNGQKDNFHPGKTAEFEVGNFHDLLTLSVIIFTDHKNYESLLFLLNTKMYTELSGIFFPFPNSC